MTRQYAGHRSTQRVLAWGTFPHADPGEACTVLAMRRQLSPSEIELLTEIVKRPARDASLLAALQRGELNDEQARFLGDVATKELARTGFDADYKLTSYGRKLEDVIDALSAT
jgi:hypothetical protein